MLKTNHQVRVVDEGYHKTDSQFHFKNLTSKFADSEQGVKARFIRGSVRVLKFQIEIK